MKGTGTCPTCGGRYRVTANGMVYRHKFTAHIGVNVWATRPCEGGQAR